MTKQAKTNNGHASDEAIRIEAYLISEKAGHPAGMEHTFWKQAEALVHSRLATIGKGVAPRKKPAAATAAKPAVARKRAPAAKPAATVKPAEIKKSAPAASAPPAAKTVPATAAKAQPKAKAKPDEEPTLPLDLPAATQAAKPAPKKAGKPAPKSEAAKAPAKRSAPVPKPKK